MPPKSDSQVGKREVESGLLTLFAQGHVMSWLARFPSRHTWSSLQQAISEFVDYVNSLAPKQVTTVHRCTNEQLFELDPDYEVYVGRPTKWGNPFKIGKTTRKQAIQLYEDWVMGRVTKPVVTKRGIKQVRPGFTLEDIKRELKGKKLYCWCHPKLCHADVLAKLADL